MNWPPDAPSPQKIGVGAAVVVILLLLAVGIASSVYTVAADSEAVVLRFGKYLSTELPGLRWKAPFGIDRVYTVPVKRVHSMEFGFQTAKAGRRTQYRTTPEQKEEAQMLTGDLNIASVEWVVQYRIKDAKAYLFSVAEVEDTLHDVSEAVMRALVGDRSVDEVITTGREALKGEAETHTEADLDRYNCGIEIVRITLQDVTPPEPVKDAFDAVNRARQQKDQVINLALAQRNRLIPAARGEKERKIKESEGYHDQKIRTVQGETRALLAQYESYRKRPEETRLRLFMETMEEVYMKAGRKVIVDPDVKGVLPLLDLGSPAAPVVPRSGTGRAAKGGAR